MYLAKKWKIRFQSTVVPLLLIGFFSSTSQSATCEQYEHLGNEKSGQLFVESLKSDFKRGTNFLTRLATLHYGTVPASVGAGCPGTA
jgi:hypothetical protein